MSDQQQQAGEAQKPAAPIDLSSLDTSAPCDTPSTMQVLHPVSEEPTGAEIDLLGADSSVARKVRREFSRTRLKKLGKKGRMELTPEQVEDESLRLLVALTVGWRNVQWQGAPLEFGAKNARMLYEKLSWLREQAQEHVGDLGAYLGNSAAASAQP